MDPIALYQKLAETIRHRFDLIESLKQATPQGFTFAETAAFHGRKVVEGIAFACLVATENGLKHVPRDAKGKWQADRILESLRSKGFKTFPSPSIVRKATPDELASNDVKAVIEGQPNRRMEPEDLIVIYRRLHRWLHETNPYTGLDSEAFYGQHVSGLWDDLARLKGLVEKHFIAISGQAFFCVLWDDVDGKTKVMPLSRPATK
jgi:hypothetical protein